MKDNVNDQKLPRKNVPLVLFKNNLQNDILVQSQHYKIK